MAIIRDNRGSLLASNLSKYLAGAANTAGTPIDTHEIVKTVNQFLGTKEQINTNTATIGNSVYKKFGETDKVINKTQVVTSGIWTGDIGSLEAAYTSSTQVASVSSRYYIDAYNDDPSVSGNGAEVQFSVAYGDINGYGVPDLTVFDSAINTSQAVYTQLRNVLLNPTDKYFSVYSGSTSAGHNLQNFYAININRSRYRERLDPGNLSLKLQGSTGKVVTLIDDSGGTDENVTTAGRVYNLVSGSLNIGSAAAATKNSYTASNGQGWGLFYPDMGILILNPKALELGVDGKLSGATAKYSNISTDSDKYFNRINAFSSSQGVIRAINAGQDFQVRRTENVSTSHYFVRANNREYNFSNNPSFVTGSTGQFVQTLFEKDPHVYITSVGLYDDAHELLAVAKTSRPIEKTFDKEVAIKVKLDF
jgi:hypothetical protein